MALIDEIRRKNPSLNNRSDDEIKAKVEELAQQYQDPAQVVEYYMSNDQLKTQVQSAILEEKAIDALLAQAVVNDVAMSYQQALAAAQQQGDEAEEADEDAAAAETPNEEKPA